MDLIEFKPMIGGVLKAGGVTYSDARYDDYFQELWVLVWHRLLETSELEAHKNNKLFRLLLWRLKDLQRCDWRHQNRWADMNEIENMVYEDDHPQIWEQIKYQLDPTLQPIFQHVLDFPEMTLQKRSERLNVHRKTLRRRLDAIGQYIK
ncbi:DNA-binding NtrC family response regulator [Weissella uvarum]|uniref:hypothetical protein n=1 Tax=Weissella uvarum TaxID=1479233 RepID=UPI001961B705|nr:hypothetical protein [Weissella uvarum]MBM7617953.1 DNA-binding NtrC family response regulator [Weissella uvarum]MCM0596172.1 hypothetical protein [Weissella uvarum]